MKKSLVTIATFLKLKYIYCIQKEIVYGNILELVSYVTHWKRIKQL